MRIKGNHIWAEAGIWVPKFVRTVGCAGFAGVEHAIGIPGTLGGLIVMNGGSQRKGIGEYLSEVRCVDMKGNVITLTQADCEFSYRYSSIPSRNLAVLDTAFVLQEGDPRTIRRQLINIMASRRKKFPSKLPNCGSVFLSNPSMYDVIGPPGFAIEKVGLKGLVKGDAQISPMHANFIVNNGRAKSRDVLNLIYEMRSKVYESTGFLMDCEVRHLKSDGQLRPAHISAEELADRG